MNLYPFSFYRGNPITEEPFCQRYYDGTKKFRLYPGFLIEGKRSSAFLIFNSNIMVDSFSSLTNILDPLLPLKTISYASVQDLESLHRAFLIKSKTTSTFLVNLSFTKIHRLSIKDTTTNMPAFRVSEFRKILSQRNEEVFSKIKTEQKLIIPG